MPGKFAPLVLSRGEQYVPPPLTPRSYGFTEWPDGTVTTTFYATDSSVIAVIDGDVTPDAITFDVDPDEVDMVPAGAWFETFLEDNIGRKMQLRYGQVIRKEARFGNTPTQVTSNKALQFRDNFYSRVGRVGSKWITILGQPTIFDNTDDGDPNGVGPNSIFFDKAAMRYYAPLNSDSWLMSFNLLNPGPGKTAIMGGCNATLTSGLFVAYESGLSNNYIHIGVVEGPVTLIDQIPHVSHTVTDNTNYKLRYDDLTKRLSLLNSSMSSELAGWDDDDLMVPHGPGYRYFGASWQASLFSSGIQLTTISAQDGVSA